MAAPVGHDSRKAGRELGDKGIDLPHPVRPETVAGAVGGVEVHLVAVAEGQDERSQPVRVLAVEGRMLEKLHDPIEGADER